MNKLTCAIFCWPSFGHIPLLCFLERLLGLTWTEKSGPLSWRPCSHQIKLHYLFQQISTCFKSLKASAPSASVESLASQKQKKLFDLCHMIRCRPFAKWNNQNFSVAASCELIVGPSWASAAASPGFLRQTIWLWLSSCRLSGLQWHILVILILEARKRFWIMHSDGSAKHEAIMKLQHSHGGFGRWMHCPNSLKSL